MEPRPLPDPVKLLSNWMEWETGETTPGRVMSNLKTAGMRELLEELAKVAEQGVTDELDAPRPVRRGGPQIIPRPQLWTPGRPAPWSQVGDTSGLIVPDRARAAVPPGRRGTPSPVAALGAAASAVLVPLYEDDGELFVVLTRRAKTLRTHKGEVSFPGGRADPGETYLQTALREAFEEVALDPGSVEPLGELDHLTTVTRHAYIVPIVGLLPGRPQLTPNPGEVDAVLHVALRELMDPEVFREEQWGAGDMTRPIYFFDLVGDTVWGATAALLRQLLARLTGVDPGAPTDLDPARGIELVHYPLGPDGLGGVV